MTACFLMEESHRSNGGAARTWLSTSACRNCFGAGWLPRYAIWVGRLALDSIAKGRLDAKRLAYLHQAAPKQGDEA
jgi:hypothetical protein